MRKSKAKPVKCATKGCKEKATSWIKCKKYCVKHFYQEQINHGKAPRKLPSWMNGFDRFNKYGYGIKSKKDKSLSNKRNAEFKPLPMKFEWGGEKDEMMEWT